MGRPLSEQAIRVIEAIGEGRIFSPRAAGWASGPLFAAAALVGELERRDLLRIGRQVLSLTPAGTDWFLRRVESRKRLLVERSLPQDDVSDKAAPRRGAAARPARSVTVNLAESPLGWFRARGLVDARQYEAGERLRGDWTIAGMAPRVTMRWDAGAPSTGDALDPALAQVAAKRRMEAALDAVGPGLKDVLWRIVCAGEGMEATERGLGWPARSGRVVLTLALDRLADSYGLK
jgi:hypothetical protein